MKQQHPVHQKRTQKVAHAHVPHSFVTLVKPVFWQPGQCIEIGIIERVGIGPADAGIMG